MEKSSCDVYEESEHKIWMRGEKIWKWGKKYGQFSKILDV